MFLQSQQSNWIVHFILSSLPTSDVVLVRCCGLTLKKIWSEKQYVPNGNEGAPLSAIDGSCQDTQK
jgi:hypothetical protein